MEAQRRNHIEEQLESNARYSQGEIEQIMSKLEEIDTLRREKGAVILAHYYQIPPILLIADKTGDSLALARAASQIRNANLVVCSTVHFMAEIVKLLSPGKKVVIPDMAASCSIAEGINGDAVRELRRQFPDAAIVGYINTTAEAKAEMDAVCTSANASLVAERIKGDPLIMLPDYFFSKNVLAHLAERDRDRTYLAYKQMENRTLVLENVTSGEITNVRTNHISLPIREKGTCVVHEQFTPEQVAHYKRKYHIDEVLAHPEVRPDVAKIADMVGGTQKMIDYAGQSGARRFLVITECDLIAPLREAHPLKEFITPCTLCPYMKKNSLDKLVHSLRSGVHEIRLNARTYEGAKRSLERMFELTA